MIIEFDYLNKDVLGTHVKVDTETGVVTAEDYTDIFYHQFFAKRPHTIKELNVSLERRCFPRTQHQSHLIVEGLGLKQYNPLDIVRITHGRLYSDFNWIRFAGEDLAWKDVENFTELMKDYPKD